VPEDLRVFQVFQGIPDLENSEKKEVLKLLGVVIEMNVKNEETEHEHL
jgi:hypothetical protein